MYGLSVYIAPEYIIDQLSEEDKKRFNQCVFTNIRSDIGGGITIDCVLFNDADAIIKKDIRLHKLGSGVIDVIK